MKPDSNKPLFNKFKFFIVLVVCIVFLAFIGIVISNSQQNEEVKDDSSEEADQESEENRISQEVNEEEAEETIEEPIYSPDIEEPVLDDPNNPPHFNDIKINNEEQVLVHIQDGILLDQIKLYKDSLVDFYRTNQRLPSNSQILLNTINSSDDYVALYAFQSFINNQLESQTVYYNPTKPNNFNISLIPESSLLIFGQTKCKTGNETVGLSSRKGIIRQVDIANIWGDPVNEINETVLIQGASSSIAMLFKLNTNGVHYTYCMHDYPHIYDLN